MWNRLQDFSSTKYSLVAISTKCWHGGFGHSHIRKKWKKEPQMKVFNIRTGFATNSSSVHSFLLVNNIADIEDEYDSKHGFDWDKFILASKEAKASYMASQLIGNFDGIMPLNTARTIIQGLTGVPKERIQYVDHQSQQRFPVTLSPDCMDFVNLDFFMDMFNYVVNNNVVIVGGNDNDDEGRSIPIDYVKRLTFCPEDSDEKIIARKDKKYNTWTLFNVRNGTKIKLSFDNSYIAGQVSTPELVDLKITDYCSKGCAFCYQGSTINGKHADQQTLRQVLNALQDLGVFEVALGGGEPTEYPDFIDLLRQIHDRNIIPNFSTKSLKWMDDSDNIAKVLKYIGAYAYSVQTEEELKELIEKIENCPNSKELKKKTTIQIIPAIVGPEELKKIFILASEKHLPVTLLGFKSNNRGADYTETNQLYDEGCWIEVYKQVKEEYYAKAGFYLKIGIDTCLANKYEQELKAMNIPSWCYYTKEGQFSMYIDTVNKVMGPSSFCNDEERIKMIQPSWDPIEYKPIDWYEEQIEKAFEGFK